MKRRVAAHGIKILVGNGISPLNQFLQQLIPSNIPRVCTIDCRPELNSQPVEIRTDPTGMRIPFVQASIPDEFRAQKPLKLRRNSRHNVIDALGMKIPTEHLE